MIGIAQLVFHDEDDAVGLVLADDVERVTADGCSVASSSSSIPSASASRSAFSASQGVKFNTS